MNYSKNDFGFIISGEEYTLQLIHYKPGILRIAYYLNEELPVSTAAVCLSPLKTNGEYNSGYFILGQFKVAVAEKSLAVKIYDHSGVLLSEDLALDPGRPELHKKLLWEKGFYGNGEKYAWLNHLGTTNTNFNSDVLFQHPLHHAQVPGMHTAIPFYLGAAPGKAYGVFFDNSFRTELDFTKTTPEAVSFKADGGRLDYYFLAGPTVEDVVDGQTTPAAQKIPWLPAEPLQL
jgi:alpha-glucosidase